MMTEAFLKPSFSEPRSIGSADYPPGMVRSFDYYIPTWEPDKGDIALKYWLYAQLEWETLGPPDGKRLWEQLEQLRQDFDESYLDELNRIRRARFMGKTWLGLLDHLCLRYLGATCFIRPPEELPEGWPTRDKLQPFQSLGSIPVAHPDPSLLPIDWNQIPFKASPQETVNVLDDRMRFELARKAKLDSENREQLRKEIGTLADLLDDPREYKRLCRDVRLLHGAVHFRLRGAGTATQCWIAMTADDGMHLGSKRFWEVIHDLALEIDIRDPSWRRTDTR